MGCSVKYSEIPSVEDKIPEFNFTDASLVRYEGSKKLVEVEAGSLEQYKDSAATYGKNIKFISYNDEGNIDTKGSCNYIYTNTDNEMYELYDNIEIISIAEEMKVIADALKWNGRSEQLTSGRGDVVKIEKENTKLKGTGFSASGISKTFSFSGNVIGSVETK